METSVEPNSFFDLLFLLSNFSLQIDIDVFSLSGSLLGVRRGLKPKSERGRLVNTKLRLLDIQEIGERKRHTQKPDWDQEGQ